MTRRIVVGIDPGLSGGIGAIDASTGDYMGALRMPVTSVTKTLNLPDTSAIVRFLDMTKLAGKVRVIIEQVSAMPKQGVTSTFSFGAGYGALIALLQMAEVPYEFVSPQKWKKASGLSSDKKLSLAKARQRWPDAPLSREKDEGVAESLLLAEWARRNGGAE